MKYQKKKFTNFTNQLSQILENKGCEQFIRFDSNRSLILILNIEMVLKQFQKRNWKLKHEASLVRQLNYYGFEKQKLPDGYSAYKNFKLNIKQINDIRKLRRKMANDSQKKDMGGEFQEEKQQGIPTEKINFVDELDVYQMLFGFEPKQRIFLTQLQILSES